VSLRVESFRDGKDMIVRTGEMLISGAGSYKPMSVTENLYGDGCLSDGIRGIILRCFRVCSCFRRFYDWL